MCRQVHGHDFSCLAAVPAHDDARYLYASGSEEKVVRVFEGPRAFLATLAAARGRAQPTDVASATATAVSQLRLINCFSLRNLFA